MNATCDRVDEATAYVLGTLSIRQRERFILHTRFCETCAEELELLNQASFVPDVMVPRVVRPPWEHEPHSRRDQDRGDSRHVSGHHDPERDESRLFSPGTADGRGRRQGQGRGRAPRRRRLQPIPKPALTMLLCLLVVAGLTVYMSHRAASTTFVRGTTAWPESAGVALQLQGSHGELLLDHLPAAPAGDHYEIWELPANNTTSLRRVNAKLTLDRAGEAGVNLPGDIHTDTAIGVYAIPNGAPGAQQQAPAIDSHPVAVVYVPKAGKTPGGGS